MDPIMKIVYPGSDGGHCPLFIGTGILADAQNALSGTEMTYRPFLITDKNLIKHGHAAALGIESSASYIIDPPGETSKCIKTVTNILNTMDERGFGRDTVILALGGGTVGDIAGFAASIFKRGIPVIQIPTTTVS
jgi:3-dehydroquinate synthetase